MSEKTFYWTRTHKNKIIAANRVVILASNIAVLDWYSHYQMQLNYLFLLIPLILSKIKTFASTAIPTVKIIPAIPGKVG